MIRWEETKEGNMERECIEESCTNEELSETVDNDSVAVAIQAKYNKCAEIVSAVEQATPEFGREYRLNLLRECILGECNDRLDTLKCSSKNSIKRGGAAYR